MKKTLIILTLLLGVLGACSEASVMKPLDKNAAAIEAARQQKDQGYMDAAVVGVVVQM